MKCVKVIVRDFFFYEMLNNENDNEQASHQYSFRQTRSAFPTNGKGGPHKHVYGTAQIRTVWGGRESVDFPHAHIQDPRFLRPVSRQLTTIW